MPSPGGPAAVTWGQPAGALPLFIPLHKMPKQLVPNHRGPLIKSRSAPAWQGWETARYISTGVGLSWCWSQH